MSAMMKVILTNLLLFLLTTQQKVNSEVILIDKAEDITYNKPEKGNTSVWYTYTGEYFERSGTTKTCADPSDGGIFTCMDEQINVTQKHMNCKFQKIFVNTSITGNNVMVPKNITIKTGQNFTFPSQFKYNGSYILLWMSRWQNISKCLFSVEVTRNLDDFSSSWNRLCCSTNDTNHEERIQFQNYSGLLDQHFQLHLFNLKSSDSGEYLNIRYTWVNGKMKWELVKRYSLNVTENEDTTPIPGPQTPHDIDGSYYTIAGSVGGFIALLAILLLSLFFIKLRGKHKKRTRSSLVGLPDDYENMPYAVSEQRKEVTNVIYALA
ncbi:uncharacterized protein LOC130366918 [Hyla sarda]|uniref:uncharacterized protein LOC130366918 n=1 Tax=Hyla sarda TaxID=327740 RepID=UPI0024C46556|nr:uncharacterized protein LOC130366918 [Hyla sarda]